MLCMYVCFMAFVTSTRVSVLELDNSLNSLNVKQPIGHCGTIQV